MQKIKTELYCGDNLLIMPKIPNESVNLIYADILYGTGREFYDPNGVLCYVDLKPDRKEIENFYIPRIKEMHRILKKNGSIYLQCDSTISHYIRLILEDIFGCKNFKNEIKWLKRTSSQNVITNYYPKSMDTILFFTKSDDYTFNIQYKNISHESIKKYGRVDENGRLYAWSPLMKRGYSKISTLVLNGKEYTGSYAWTQKTLDNRIAKGEIVEENSLGELAYRMYLDDNIGKQISDLWDDLVESSHTKEYPTQKPLDLMTRIIKSSSNEYDTIFDPFCGSGQFLTAGKLLNRNSIGIDINKNAISLAQRKLNQSNNLFNS